MKEGEMGKVCSSHNIKQECIEDFIWEDQMERQK
jgi:hypothetical protein